MIKIKMKILQKKNYLKINLNKKLFNILRVIYYLSFVFQVFIYWNNSKSKIINSRSFNSLILIIYCF